MHKVDANGAAIPAIGFGTWELRDAQARRMVEAALEIGYRHIDTAQMYGNEAEVGEALRGSGLNRDELFVTTKIWPDRFRDGELQRSVRASLDKLQLDAVDLLLLHWPNSDVPLAETMAALEECAARGWTRHIGVSNFPQALLEEAVRLSARPLATDQVEYHPFLSQKTVLEACSTHGMALTAYCPLARGRVFADPTLGRIAQRHGKTPGQVALRWLVQQEEVVAIPRSSRVEHVRANFEVFDFALSEPEMAEIAALGTPHGRLVAVGASAPAWDPV
jgi:diketogulonate reductase-like aldo/keto reductase